MIYRFLNPRSRSLLRGTLLVLVSLGVSVLLSDFPNNHATPLLILPVIAAVAGTIDHVRCVRTRWSLYHGGVLLMIYMDLMALGMMLFFLIYPYALWLTHSA
ncbi:MAG TPA: permease [Edaphobacter sp.]|nr:permease [Edaphobacter sp.]